MASSNRVAPVIIKRKKVVAGEGHHGGAWKVAILRSFSTLGRFGPGVSARLGEAKRPSDQCDGPASGIAPPESQVRRQTAP